MKETVMPTQFFKYYEKNYLREKEYSSRLQVTCSRK